MSFKLNSVIDGNEHPNIKDLRERFLYCKKGDVVKWDPLDHSERKMKDHWVIKFMAFIIYALMLTAQETRYA